MENVRIVGRRPGRLLPSVRGIGRLAVIYERERRERAENVARRGGGHNDGERVAPTPFRYGMTMNGYARGYIPETILRAKVAYGQVLYQVKWFGWHETSCYIESSVLRANDPHMIVEFYEDITIHPPMPEWPADTPTLKDTKSYDGFSENRELLAINQAIFDHTKILYYTMWTGLVYPQWTDSRELRENSFEMIIDYWESRVNEVINAMKNNG